MTVDVKKTKKKVETSTRKLQKLVADLTEQRTKDARKTTKKLRKDAEHALEGIDRRKLQKQAVALASQVDKDGKKLKKRMGKAVARINTDELLDALSGMDKRKLGLVLGGIGLGALLAYTMDPRKGAKRREKMLAQAETTLDNLKPRRLMGGVGPEHRRAIDVHKSIDVEATPAELYDYWMNFENFPRFMSHVREVRDLGNGRSHWVAEGPADMPVEWDAMLTQDIPGEMIAWKSMPGSQIRNAGSVRFESIANGATRVHVHMTYNPPGGPIGHVVAMLFGKDPKQAMDKDLARFKELIEQGEVEGQSMGLDQPRESYNGADPQI